MATPSGKPGRQYTFTVTILDGNGDPQDLTLLDGYALIASVGEKKVIAQWSKNSVTGFLSLTETDAANGEVEIVLPAKCTATIENELVMIEPVIQLDDEVFSSKDGKSFELIKITASAKAKMPDLS